MDILEKTRKTWCEKNIYPSEPVFVPDPNGKVRDLVNLRNLVSIELESTNKRKRKERKISNVLILFTCLFNEFIFRTKTTAWFSALLFGLIKRHALDC